MSLVLKNELALPHISERKGEYKEMWENACLYMD